MKVHLATKNDDVKDNDPAGNFNTRLKCIKNKSEQQEQHIYNDSGVPQCNKSAFQPGQRQYLGGISFIAFFLFYIPENNSYQKTEVE
jgi:hypothetical protein